MRSDLLLYVSGPMTACEKHSIEDHVTAGVSVYFALLRAGLPAFSPHLSGMFPTAWTLLPHADWLTYDKAIIDRCTHVVMMTDWLHSKGARIEQEYATQIGKPIRYQPPFMALDAWAAQLAKDL